MAKLKVVHRETIDHELVIEIGDEHYDGSEEQQLEILEKSEAAASQETVVRHLRQTIGVDTLRAGTTVPTDVPIKLYEPEF